MKHGKLLDMYLADFKALRKIIERAGISRKADDVLLVVRHEHKRKPKFCPGFYENARSNNSHPENEPRLADFKIVYNRHRKYSIYICAECLGIAVIEYCKKLVEEIMRSRIPIDEVKPIAKGVLKHEKYLTKEEQAWALATVLTDLVHQNEV